MEYQRIDNTYGGSHRSVPCQDTICSNPSTTYAHGETKDAQQGEHQTAETDLINAVEQAHASRDAEGGAKAHGDLIGAYGGDW